MSDFSANDTMEARAEEFRSAYKRVKDEIGKVIVGHDEIVHGVLTCLFVGGHALLEGVPGLGKTLLVRTLADAVSLDFNRIQFTPDLMPADIIGTNVVMETPDGRRVFEFQRGPLFSHSESRKGDLAFWHGHHQALPDRPDQRRVGPGRPRHPGPEEGWP
ncbi:AAA family ATPase, partial [Tautonia sociabilis]|uniref:AAA family ATPase n=1 Tax=Tautonia sociabilis TaxID=2080755 RepID=UPI001F2B4021